MIGPFAVTKRNGVLLLCWLAAAASSCRSSAHEPALMAESTFITGTVLNEEGKPASDLRVVTVRTDGAWYDRLLDLPPMAVSAREGPALAPGVPIDATGAFRAEVRAPGRYRVQVLTIDGEREPNSRPLVRWEGTVDASEGGATTIPLVKLAPLVRITGRIDSQVAEDHPAFVEVRPSSFSAGRHRSRLTSDGSFGVWVPEAADYTLTLRTLTGAPYHWPRNTNEKVPFESAMQTHYLEIVTSDVDATCNALEQVHGITFSDPQMELGNARTAVMRDGGTMGVRAPMHEAEGAVARPYLLVEDIDAAIEAAKAAGGEIALPPMEIPGRGKCAIYLLGGNQFGLWQSLP